MNKRILQSMAAVFTALLLVLSMSMLITTTQAEASENAMTLRFVDPEDETPLLGTCLYTYDASLEGENLEISSWELGDYLSLLYTYTLPNYNAVNVMRQNGSTVDIVVLRSRIYSVTIQMCDKETGDVLAEAAQSYYEIAGVQRHISYELNLLCPTGYGYEKKDYIVTLGVDKVLSIPVVKQQTYPITIRYMDGSQEDTVLSESTIHVSGVAGEQFSVQPEDGLMPFGWNAADSCETTVILGETSVAVIPLMKESSFPINVTILEEGTEKELSSFVATFNGFTGDSVWICNSITEPTGYALTDDSWSTMVTLGSDADVNVYAVETPWVDGLIHIKLVDEETNQEVQTILYDPVNYYGNEYLSSDILPDGWSFAGSQSIMLSNEETYTVMVVSDDTPEQDEMSYPIRIHFIDVETNQEVGVTTEYRSESDVDTYYWFEGSDDVPEGYEWTGFRPGVLVGEASDMNVYVRSNTSCPPAEVTLIGVLADDPTQVLDTKTVSVPLSANESHGWNFNIEQFITPPIGYTLARSRYFMLYPGVSTTVTYYLEPTQTDWMTVNYVDVSDGNRIIGTEQKRLSSDIDNYAYFLMATPPEGWYALQERYDFWIYNMPTTALSIPVMHLETGSVTTKFVDFYSGETVGTKEQTVVGIANTASKLEASQVTLPAGWELMSQAARKVVIGQKEPLVYKVRRAPESLKTVTLPLSTQTIEADAFAGTDFQRVIVPDGVTTIGAGAFSSMDSLYYVVLPDSVETIYASAFANSTVVLICKSGSMAEGFAQLNEIPYDLE